MNAPVPSGMEILLSRILKMIGIKPDDIVVPLTQVRDKVVSAEARLAACEMKLDRIIKHLGIQTAEGQHNGLDGSEQ